MSLKATVQSLRNRAEDARLSLADREGFIATWRDDVADLYDRIRSAITDVLDADVVSFASETIEVSEEDLGRYQIDTMTMTIVDQIICLEPVARMTIGGTGRVDMYREDRPSEDSRVFLVRGSSEVQHSPDAWLIERKRSKTIEEMATRYIVRGYRTYAALTAESIQEAVDSLLKSA